MSLVTVACFLPDRAKDLSAPRYRGRQIFLNIIVGVFSWIYFALTFPKLCVYESNDTSQSDVFMHFLQNDNPESSSQSNTDKHDVNGSDSWEEMDAVSTKPNCKSHETVNIDNLVVLKI